MEENLPLDWHKDFVVILQISVFSPVSVEMLNWKIFT